MRVACLLLVANLGIAAAQQDVLRSGDPAAGAPSDGTAAPRAGASTSRTQANDGLAVERPPLDRRILSRLENRLNVRLTREKLTQARDALLGDDGRDWETEIDRTRYRDAADRALRDPTRPEAADDGFATAPLMM